MMVETPGFRLTILQDPYTVGTAATRARGPQEHRQPDGAEQIEQAGEAALIPQRATLALNEAAQKEREEADEGMHVDFLVCPMVLGADGQVVDIFKLAA